MRERDDVGWTCAGSGHELGSENCVPEDHYEGCGEQFGSLRWFDKHFIGRGSARRCATTEELLQLGLYLNADGVWKQTPSEADTERLRRLKEKRKATT